MERGLLIPRLRTSGSIKVVRDFYELCRGIFHLNLFVLLSCVTSTVPENLSVAFMFEKTILNL